MCIVYIGVTPCDASDATVGIDTYPKMFSNAYMEGREEILVEAMLSADIESKVRYAYATTHRRS